MVGPPVLGIGLTVARERMTARHPAGVSARRARPRPEGTGRAERTAVGRGGILPGRSPGPGRALGQSYRQCSRKVEPPGRSFSGWVRFVTLVSEQIRVPE